MAWVQLSARITRRDHANHARPPCCLSLTMCLSLWLHTPEPLQPEFTSIVLTSVIFPRNIYNLHENPACPLEMQREHITANVFFFRFFLFFCNRHFTRLSNALSDSNHRTNNNLMMINVYYWDQDTELCPVYVSESLPVRNPGLDRQLIISFHHPLSVGAKILTF